jgi:hypothetical protein
VRGADAGEREGERERERERELLYGKTATGCEVTEEGDALCDMGVPTFLS